MDIISVWNEKGGVGKTTMSFNLAGAAHAKGLSVLLIDRDPQGSCAWMYKDGNSPFQVVSELPKTSPDVDLIIFDMPPQTNEIPRGTVVIPFQPTRLGYGVVPKHLAYFKENNKRVVQVANMVDKRKGDHRTFALEMAKRGVHIVASRSIYERVTGLGRTVFDPSLTGMYGLREAKKEINALLEDALK